MVHKCVGEKKKKKNIVLCHFYGGKIHLAGVYYDLEYFYFSLKFFQNDFFFFFFLLGKYQARILSEGMLTPSDYQKEVNYQLVTGKVETLGSFFSTLCPGT